ncbi:MAG TPA: hypothetical protein VFO78_10505 [Candidatus Limnocylindrales bacterium]|nr:hypothetical protein [Candidatus Limnocylindrales bacterium]
MTASEFAFLALGLVLGAATGAALVQVLRARAPSRREIRVTVAPNSIPPRGTVVPPEARGPDQMPGPARGGPADRRWVDRELGEQPAVPAMEGAAIEATDEVPGGGGNASIRTPVPGAASAAPFRLMPSPTATTAGERTTLVGISIAREPDPQMTSLRAAAPPAARMIRQRVAVATGEPGGGSLAGEPGGGSSAGVPSIAGPAAGGSSVAGSSDGVPEAAASADPANPTAGPGGGPDLADGCLEERRIADERCAVSTRAREGAREAVEALRAAQRAYDDHVGRAEEEAAAADPRTVRSAKEAAQQAFRVARGAATTREAVEAAARDWLTEINRINHATREAGIQAERHRAAAADLAPALERLAVEADAARISAETAEEACVAAREAVAACQEEAARVAAGLAAAEATAAEASTAEPPVGAAAAYMNEDDDSLATPMGSRAGEDAAIIRLLRGDREVMTRTVARLAGDDEAERRRWQTALGALLEALVARTIEASAFDYPSDHPFWGMFSRAQCRDISAALSSLGYRHDGFGEWADDRVPGQRDLSLAVGYAGLDPMRIRVWPNEEEMRGLLRDVTVAADEYVWEAAGSLSLGELISMLGRRADGLTELWNEWGTIRPLLLSAD